MEIIIKIIGGLVVLSFILTSLHYGLKDPIRALGTLFIGILASIWIYYEGAWRISSIIPFILFMLIVMYNMRDLGFLVLILLLYLDYQLIFNQKQNSYKPSTRTDNKEEQMMYIVNTNALIIREEPTIKSKKVGLLHKDELVVFIKKDSFWFYIENKGWVYSKFLRQQK